MTLTDQRSSETYPAYLPLREEHGQRRRYRKITTDEKDLILKMYEEGSGPTLIGKSVDRDPAIVRRVLNDKGIETPKLRWDARKAMKMLEAGVDVEEVSRIIGKPVSAIRQYAVRHRRG